MILNTEMDISTLAERAQKQRR